MEPKLVVIMLPFRQKIFQVGGFQIDGRVELLQIRFLGTFDLAVKSQACWGGTCFHKPPLNLFREKFHPEVGLDALRRQPKSVL